MVIRFLTTVRVGPARVVGRPLRVGRRGAVVAVEVIDLGADRRVVAAATIEYARLDEPTAAVET